MRYYLFLFLVFDIGFLVGFLFHIAQCNYYGYSYKHKTKNNDLQSNDLPQ